MRVCSIYCTTYFPSINMALIPSLTWKTNITLTANNVSSCLCPHRPWSRSGHTHHTASTNSLTVEEEKTVRDCTSQSVELPVHVCAGYRPSLSTANCHRLPATGCIYLLHNTMHHSKSWPPIQAAPATILAQSTTLLSIFSGQVHRILLQFPQVMN